MKTKIFFSSLALAALFVFSGCSSAYLAASSSSDDLYSQHNTTELERQLAAENQRLKEQLQAQQTQDANFEAVAEKLELRGSGLELSEIYYTEDKTNSGGSTTVMNIVLEPKYSSIYYGSWVDYGWYSPWYHHSWNSRWAFRNSFYSPYWYGGGFYYGWNDPFFYPSYFYYPYNKPHRPHRPHYTTKKNVIYGRPYNSSYSRAPISSNLASKKYSTGYRSSGNATSSAISPSNVYRRTSNTNSTYYRDALANDSSTKSSTSSSQTQSNTYRRASTSSSTATKTTKTTTVKPSTSSSSSSSSSTQRRTTTTSSPSRSSSSSSPSSSSSSSSSSSGTYRR